MEIFQQQFITQLQPFYCMQIEREKFKAAEIEIKSQLLQIDIKLKNTELVSEFVDLLIKKRELVELLNHLQNEL